MLASRLLDLLPELDDDQALETASIRSLPKVKFITTVGASVPFVRRIILRPWQL